MRRLTLQDSEDGDIASPLPGLAAVYANGGDIHVKDIDGNVSGFPSSASVDASVSAATGASLALIEAYAARKAGL